MAKVFQKGCNLLVNIIMAQVFKQFPQQWDTEEEKGRRGEGVMWCCHNETMSEEKPRLISCKSSKYGEEWRAKQAEKGGGRKHGGSDGGKQLVWLLAARMKIHHCWNMEAWESITLCHNKALRGNVNMFFIVAETAGDKLSVKGRYKKTAGGCGWDFFFSWRTSTQTEGKWTRNQ